MKKFIIITLVVLVLLFSLGVVYLNNVFLPKTIKALIIKGIEEGTDSKVTLGSLRVNIFKGLVLTDLNIYKEENAIIKVKEASCVVIPLPILRKQIIIPNISVKSAQIFLERRKDNTLNIVDLFSSKPALSPAVNEPAKPANAPASKGFNVSVYRVSITGSKVTFKDSTFNKPFVKTVENLNLVAYLSLPASVKFKFSAVIPAAQSANPVNDGIKLAASGEFKVLKQELNAKLNLFNFSPAEFSPYFEDSGLVIGNSPINASADLKMQNGVFYVDAEAQAKNIKLSRAKTEVKANADVRAVLEYSLKDKILKYSGSGQISDTQISGIDFIDKISDLKAQVIFDNSGLKTDNLTASVLGLSIKAKALLSDFSDPAVSIDATSGINLFTFQGILKDKLKFDFPGSITGEGKLYFTLRGKLTDAASLTANADIEFVGAAVKLNNLDSPLQEINGKVSLFNNRLHWESLSLKYQGNNYVTGGSLINFKSPLLDITIKSDDFSLASVLNFNGKLIKVIKCSGSYGLSDFSVSGDIDIADQAHPQVDLTGTLLVDLKGLKKSLSKYQETLDKIKPEGKIQAKFNLSGNPKDLKSCSVDAILTGDSVSAYGLKGSGLLLNYAQADGIAKVLSAHLSLYSGSLDVSFKANLMANDNPYIFNANIQGIKMEELKLDTLAKAKDISGIIQGNVLASGSLTDILNSQGNGSISITDGKLWELDLFKGMGKLLFSKDLASVKFSEGSCQFGIQDKSIFTEKLMLKSNMVNLSGPVRIGFDGTISAKLNVDILDEFVPLTGTFKDVTTAIIGQSGKFAVIKISGTLKEPKYSFQTAVTDIIKGLADTFLKRI